MTIFRKFCKQTPNLQLGDYEILTMKRKHYCPGLLAITYIPKDY